MRQSWLQRRWPVLRARGRVHFVLVYGLLLVGGLMSVGIALLLLLAARQQPLHLGAVLPLVPLLCLPAGVLWGVLAWHWNEYLFRKLGFDRDISSR
jgi:hypothetical protein